MIRISFSRSPREDNTSLLAFLQKLIGLKDFHYEIRKKSLDARRGKAKFVYTVDIFLNNADEESIAAICGGTVLPNEEEYQFPTPKSIPQKRPVIAGFGPAGIFCALMLARAGLKPIVLERGKSGEERKKRR